MDGHPPVRTPGRSCIANPTEESERSRQPRGGVAILLASHPRIERAGGGLDPRTSSGSGAHRRGRATVPPLGICSDGEARDHSDLALEMVRSGSIDRSTVVAHRFGNVIYVQVVSRSMSPGWPWPAGPVGCVLCGGALGTAQVAYCAECRMRRSHRRQVAIAVTLVAALATGGGSYWAYENLPASGTLHLSYQLTDGSYYLNWKILRQCSGGPWECPSSVPVTFPMRNSEASYVVSFSFQNIDTIGNATEHITNLTLQGSTQLGAHTTIPPLPGISVAPGQIVTFNATLLMPGPAGSYNANLLFGLDTGYTI